MNNIMRIVALSLALCGLVNAQTALTQTTLSAAMSGTTNTMTVASATGFTVGYYVCIYDYGAQQCETARIRVVSSTTITTDARTKGWAHPSGAVVLAGPAAGFYTYDPHGTCTAANTSYTPWVNTQTGDQWICASATGGAGTWVAGWGNSAPKVASANVASQAGATLPSGPFFHTTGTNAITGWTLPVGFHGGNFTTVFDGAATWTAAGNIAVASGEATTAGCAVTFTYDNGTAKWYASIITCTPTP